MRDAWLFRRFQTRGRSPSPASKPGKRLGVLLQKVLLELLSRAGAGNTRLHAASARMIEVSRVRDVDLWPSRRVNESRLTILQGPKILKCWPIWLSARC